MDPVLTGGASAQFSCDLQGWVRGLLTGVGEVPWGRGGPGVENLSLLGTPGTVLLGLIKRPKGEMATSCLRTLYLNMMPGPASATL